MKINIVGKIEKLYASADVIIEEGSVVNNLSAGGDVFGNEVIQGDVNAGGDVKAAIIKGNCNAGGDILTG